MLTQLTLLTSLVAAAAAAGRSTQADDVAVILFENTELRVWEQRLPPNSSGTVPVEPAGQATAAREDV